MMPSPANPAPIARRRAHASMVLATGVLALAMSTHAADNPASENVPDLSALQDEQWLAFPAERGQSGSFRGLLERHLAPDPAITTIDSLTAQKRLIEAGLGIALMPIANIREELRIGSLRLIDVDGLNARIPVVAVRRTGGYQSRVVTDFLALLTR